MQIDLIIKSEFKGTIGSNKITLGERICNALVTISASYFIIMTMVVLLRG